MLPAVIVHCNCCWLLVVKADPLTPVKVAIVPLVVSWLVIAGNSPAVTLLITGWVFPNPPVNWSVPDVVPVSSVMFIDKVNTAVVLLLESYTKSDVVLKLYPTASAAVKGATPTGAIPAGVDTKFVNVVIPEITAPLLSIGLILVKNVDPEGKLSGWVHV